LIGGIRGGGRFRGSRLRGLDEEGRCSIADDD
jgi:hypothetical protein